ncbi:MAG TPA: helix-turn-helix domain-containing protein [Anaerolineales bacterium]|nr:helix-turn-helix domain-containing protein [Anaerolineales bacterium]
MSRNLTLTDPRTRRTRQALRVALSQLLQQRDFDSLTVQEIADHAAVNRATFYLHFIDKYDLLSDTVRGIILGDQTNSVAHGDCAETVGLPRAPSSIEQVFARIDRERHVFQRLVDRRGSASLAAQLLDLLEQPLREFRSDHTPVVPQPVASRFVAGGLISLIALWVERPGVYTPCEMAAWYWRLLQAPAALQWIPAQTGA